MAYRDEFEALNARHASLERALEEIEGRTKELDALRERREGVRRQLAETAALLRNASTKRALPILEDVRIASPCSANWDEMAGDDRVRFCGGCAKNVFNLSAMPREEAEQLLASRGESLCVRLYKRADGTVITGDCPVGVKKKRVRKAALAAVGGGLMAAMSAIALTTSSRATTGAIAPTAARAPTESTAGLELAARPETTMRMGRVSAAPPPKNR